MSIVKTSEGTAITMGYKIYVEKNGKPEMAFEVNRIDTKGKKRKPAKKRPVAKKKQVIRKRKTNSSSPGGLAGLTLTD